MLTKFGIQIGKIVNFNEKYKKYVDRWVTWQWYDDRQGWNAMNLVLNGDLYNHNIQYKVILFVEKMVEC